MLQGKRGGGGGDKREGGRDGETDRQTDTETDRLTDRWTDRQTDRDKRKEAEPFNGKLSYTYKTEEKADMLTSGWIFSAF